MIDMSRHIGHTTPILSRVSGSDMQLRVAALVLKSPTFASIYVANDIWFDFHNASKSYNTLMALASRHLISSSELVSVGMHANETKKIAPAASKEFRLLHDFSNKFRKYIQLVCRKFDQFARECFNC